MANVNEKIRVALVGGSGYVGYEVIRILKRHPKAELIALFGHEKELCLQLTKMCTLPMEKFTIERLVEIKPDVTMLCVPHKVAMEYVSQIRRAGLRCIDWSADYRIKDAAEYEKWYKHPHTDAEGLAQAVYGLPEFFADKIKTAQIIANPGCYPTSAALAIAPVLKAGLIEPKGIICNSISGISGAGRSPSLAHHYPERNENFEPYGVATHRHTPEIEQTLKTITGKDVEVLFQPHLCPMDRGMLSTIYATPTRAVTADEVVKVLTDAYADKPFIRIRTKELPATKYVSQSNYCDISAAVVKGKVVLFAAIDNLLKGASGQAVQNMNLMFGFDEEMGLY